MSDKVPHVVGVEELQALLRAMPVSLARRAFGRGPMAAARLVLKDARRRVQAGPEDTGNLRRALVAQAAKRPRVLAALAFVSVRSQVVIDPRRRGDKGNPAKYAHLVEFGAPAAGVPRQPFLRPAVDAMASRAVEVMLGAAAKEAERVAAELAGRAPMRAATRRALQRR